MLVSLYLLPLVHVVVCIVAVVIMVVFPSSLTEEEEALQKKYAKLKKKVYMDCVNILVTLK